MNSSHRIVRFGNRPARIKTPEAKEFEECFQFYLSEYSSLKDFILESYNPEKHSIQVEAFFYLNDKDYFTNPKKGNKTISKKSMDLDNMLKCSFDNIFRWLNIDDSQVTKLVAEKIPTNDDATMIFRVSLTKYPELFLVHPESV